MVANQSAPELNRVLSSNCWSQRSANHVKFIKESVICSEKQILQKKLFTNELNMSLPQQTSVKKTMNGVKTQ